MRGLCEVSGMGAIKNNFVLDGFEVQTRIYPPGTAQCYTRIMLKPEHDIPENYVEHVWYEDPYGTGDCVEHRTRIIKQSVPEEWTEEVPVYLECWVAQARVIDPQTGADRASSFLVEEHISEEAVRERLMEQVKRMTEVMNDNRHCT